LKGQFRIIVINRTPECLIQKIQKCCEPLNAQYKGYKLAINPGMLNTKDTTSKKRKEEE